MKIEGCITIGIVGASEELPVGDLINSILAQSYGKIELIITMIERSERIFNNLAYFINASERKNDISIKYHIVGNDEPLVNHFEYIRDNSTGEYISFIRMQDSVYDSATIETCIEEIELHNEYNAYMFSTLVYEDDAFKEMCFSCGQGELPCETDVSFIFKNNKRFLFREYENETFEDIVWNMWIHSINTKSDKVLCRNIKMRYQEEKLVISEAQKIPYEQYKDGKLFETLTV